MLNITNEHKTQKCRYCLNNPCQLNCLHFFEQQDNELLFDGIYYCLVCGMKLESPFKWMCFDKERKNWELKLGKSKDHLSDILKKTDKIDCFFHDSEHSYSNMMYEFETAWPHIKKGGILFSDDLTPAFDDFVKKLNPKPQLVLKFRTQTNNGLLIK